MHSLLKYVHLGASKRLDRFALDSKLPIQKGQELHRNCQRLIQLLDFHVLSPTKISVKIHR